MAKEKDQKKPKTAQKKDKKMKENPENDIKMPSVEDQLQEALDGWRRAKADYDNFKRRVDEEKQFVVRMANKDLILDLLPVLDNFDSAFDSLPEGETNNWIVGFEFIKKQLESLLEQYNVKEIKAVGEQFDPELHEAAAKEFEEGKKEDEILKVQRKGYMLYEEVIRPARVIVCGKQEK